MMSMRTPTRMSSNFDIHSIDTQARKIHTAFIDRKKMAESSRKSRLSLIVKKIQESSKGLEADLKSIAQDELALFQTKPASVDSVEYTMDSDVIIDA